MTDTVSNAIARTSGTEKMVEDYRGDFARVLPAHIPGDAFARLAVGALRRDDLLRQAAEKNPASFFRALLECARLGHEPDSPEFALVPLGGEVNGWEQYRGIVERMYRAGQVASVKVELVKENDKFYFNPGTMAHPDHEVEWFADRGKTVGAYAYAEMVGGGTSKVVVIDREYIAKVKAEAKGANRADSPWVKWEDSQILKTAAKRLEPWVPTSREWRRPVQPMEVGAPAPVKDITPIVDGEPIQAEATVIATDPEGAA